MSREQNPILQLAVSRGRWPSPRVSFYAAFALGMLSLIIGLVAVILAPNNIQPLVLLALVISYSLLSITPFVTAISAGLLTVESRADPMLRLTTLSPIRWVVGHIAASLFKVRVLLILLIGLLPLSVIGGMYLSINVAMMIAGVDCPPGSCMQGYHLEVFRPDFISEGLTVLWISLLGVLFTLLAAAIGVLMGQTARRRFVVVIGGPIMFGIVAIITIAGWTVLALLIQGWFMTYAAPPIILIAALLIAVYTATGDPDRIADVPDSLSSGMRQ